MKRLKRRTAMGFEPTYKELKPEYIEVVKIETDTGFEPTYKELKQILDEDGEVEKILF